MTLLRCRGCASFFDKKLKSCPGCGVAKAEPNEALVSQRWRSSLNAQAAHAVKYG